MLDFENEHLSLIELYAKNALDIERTIFTKLYGLNEHHYSLLAIQSIAILYSYWEGYVQKSFQLYIDFINEQSVPFNMLSKEIIVFHMDNVFKQFSEYPRTVQKKIVFFDKLNAHFTTEKHEIYRIVNTQSNVDFKVLNHLLEQFSLEQYNECWKNYSYPNASLKDMLNTFIRYRNGVSHGGDTDSEEKVTQDVYAKYRHLVVDLMYDMHEKFMDGIRNKTYTSTIGIRV